MMPGLKRGFFQVPKKTGRWVLEFSKSCIFREKKSTGNGYKPLVTQHYPFQGKTEATLDLVLIPKD